MIVSDVINYAEYPKQTERKGGPGDAFDRLSTDPMVFIDQSAEGSSNLYLFMVL